MGDKTIEMVRVLQALGQSTRWDICGALCRAADGLTVGEVVGMVGVTQGCVSGHLRILHDAGVVDVERHGKWRVYKIDKALVGRVAECLEGVLG